MTRRPPTEQTLRKSRGAFFTPDAIAEYLATWAMADDPRAKVLDPTCGEAVFLLAAARRLRELGRSTSQIREQVFGVDLHEGSLAMSATLLGEAGLDATLVPQDFFAVPAPSASGSVLPQMDAVIGNPPFIRYQQHAGATRQRAAAAALLQGVRLSGLASSWAALLVHASGFLKPQGRLAMVLPAELLTVHYAEPIRRWLRKRFAAVHLVMFERLQFADALEKVVLLVAQGSGGCDAFSLYLVEDAEDLGALRPFDHLNVAPAERGKWTDMLLTQDQRQLFRRVTRDHYVPLEEYGRPVLGTVTGANNYFTLSEETRLRFGISTQSLVPVCPPGTRHLRGFAFTKSDWEALRASGAQVWLLSPSTDRASGVRAYLRHGEKLGIPSRYKCRVRTPWWRPPAVTPPDLFFTYMSHRYPRLLANEAGTTILNSMHGIRLRPGAPTLARSALPLLLMNSLTMLGAEMNGRSYGGGILKMEPREAASLPVPSPQVMKRAWELLRSEQGILEAMLGQGEWERATEIVDGVVLRRVAGLDDDAVKQITTAAASLRKRRLGK